uniref:Uncharacterized protein n=1 Tax=Craspedostauros australis TaxID=1486917 RepID=A0A7R9WTL7_9STRA|mmetsp:Transcript_19536/g.54278  ORF Transcript_19536/g.54278 Transcript_19536/m.54278 type:complete len:474 (+) Transcript_19536:211-1632(+)|eukprot:CAMPEP_0198127528 /NCGR_PEP_ID=MMETSP1442-20131203/47363_1 /TAXON_ID= /ORGANISM="Craspedostauros australis, Strain CCMP3328" /LENGTH=473 /DNA_ID=CAMNT_0043787511 /DNA_START=71 /DNA_END=1492 /DNA_ORIENTATION=+
MRKEESAKQHETNTIHHNANDHTTTVDHTTHQGIPPDRIPSHRTAQPMNPQPTLPGYEVQPDEDGVAHSKSKLDGAYDDLRALTTVRLYPCLTNAESLAYRCRCSFQIVDPFAYAMRHNREPVKLNSDVFPIGTRRIQRAMRGFLQHVASYDAMKQHLRGVKFSSSWYDGDDADCIMTLIYDNRVDAARWIEEACQARQMLGLRQINGRSKGVLLTTAAENEGSEAIIRDRVRIVRANDDVGGWEATVESPFVTTPAQSPQDIWYEKPETAFYHPNGNAMKKALGWMLNRLEHIASIPTASDNNAAPTERPRIRLLEMYCGCGAHTMALAKSDLLSEIVAIEMDQRLVQACERNIVLNDLSDVVHVRKEDAGKWARRFISKMQKYGAADEQGFDVLLVDPPRMGLDALVCKMAKQGGFQHFLYISCGRKALLRDLELLSDTFEVADCVVMDLFPRLDAVETLVHLKRKAGAAT